MNEYDFEVYETRHKTVRVYAVSREEAEDKIEVMLDSIDLNDAILSMSQCREWEYVETIE